jgi:hypothetical protein
VKCPDSVSVARIIQAVEGIRGVRRVVVQQG